MLPLSHAPTRSVVVQRFKILEVPGRDLLALEFQGGSHLPLLLGELLLQDLEFLDLLEGREVLQGGIDTFADEFVDGLVFTKIRMGGESRSSPSPE
jgi:hypothetical protein